MAKKVKIRVLSNWSIFLTTLIAVVCIAISFVGYQKYTVLRTAMQDYISCEAAAQELKAGSDMLTKQARLAAATGRQEYIDAYFEEANVTKTHEKALDDLAALSSNADAVAELREALSYSVGLMDTEYHAMRLIEEAMHVESSL